MDKVQAEQAEKEFKELLSAYWVAQLAQMRAQSNSDESLSTPDPRRTNQNVRQGDAR